MYLGVIHEQIKGLYEESFRSRARNHLHSKGSSGFIPNGNLALKSNFPKLIHLTLPNKNSYSNTTLRNIRAWKRLNPEHEIRIYDDADLLKYMETHFPQFMELFNGLPSNVERTDMWRYLVLYQHGGVYADTDVYPLQPIDYWHLQLVS
jgi:mannosyltransferase OCH1-like enzyme